MFFDRETRKAKHYQKAIVQIEGNQGLEQGGTNGGRFRLRAIGALNEENERQKEERIACSLRNRERNRKTGGERGIRTPEREYPVNGFRDRRLRPLSHLSGFSEKRVKNNIARKFKKASGMTDFYAGNHLK